MGKYYQAEMLSSDDISSNILIDFSKEEIFRDANNLFHFLKQQQEQTNKQQEKNPFFN